MMSQSHAKRKADELSVPVKGEDPEERKRVLNVLAQRRYRQRRREHVKKLESAVKSPQVAATEQKSLPPTEASDSADSAHVSPVVDESSFNKLDEAYPPEVFDYSNDTVPLDRPAGAPDNLLDYDFTYTAFPDDLQLSTANDAWQLPWLPASPSPLSSTHGSSLTSFSTPASSKATPPCDFPDEAHLEVLELALLRGATSIASRLGVSSLIWSLDSVSPFSDPLNAFSDYSHLPPNLRPTPLQRAEIHHPILDLLPWPTVRDKLIRVFSIPMEMRPGVAAKPTALVDFVYDIEDSAEGVRIWGDDPYSDRNWEVGEKVFKGWWWAFDTDVVERSNIMRELRGARLLGQGEGAVLGELT